MDKIYLFVSMQRKKKLMYKFIFFDGTSDITNFLHYLNFYAF